MFIQSLRWTTINVPLQVGKSYTSKEIINAECDVLHFENVMTDYDNKNKKVCPHLFLWPIYH